VGMQVEKTTLDDMINTVLKDYRANEHSSIKRIGYAAQHLHEYFSDARALEITGDRMTEYIA
jgi:hypothetical protein